jgi:hypothetical protein
MLLSTVESWLAHVVVCQERERGKDGKRERGMKGKEGKRERGKERKREREKEIRVHYRVHTPAIHDCLAHSQTPVLHGNTFASSGAHLL